MRVTSRAQVIPSGTSIAFRTEEAPDEDDLADLNLGEGLEATRLTSGWGIITPPQSITRIEGRNFLLDPVLTDCRNLRGVVVIVSYSARSRRWSLSMPCHPEAEARLTIGENAPYRPLTSVSPGDTTYFYTRTDLAINIEWNPETQTYQPASS